MKLKHLLIGMLAFVAAVSCKEDQPVETPTLKVSETSLSFAAEGGEKSFNLTANLDWTATPDADWLSVEPTSGKGSDKATAIKVTADENTTAEARTATVKVKAGALSETISVSQAMKKATEPEQPEQPEQPEPSVPAIEAGPYWIMGTKDNVTKVMSPLAADRNYGYAPSEEAVDGKSYAKNVFTFAAVEGGFTIADVSGRYYYQEKGTTYNTFNVGTDGKLAGCVWTVAKNDDGTYTIVNAESGKTIRYAEDTFTSFGVYTDKDANGSVLVNLVKADSPLEDKPAEPVVDVPWTLGTNAYTETATINGTADVPVLKIGTSKAVGDAQIKIPAGTTTVKFSAVAWKEKSTKLTFSAEGLGTIHEVTLNGNNGAAGTAPYTITTDGSEVQNINVYALVANINNGTPAPLPTDLVVTVTTDATNYRAILWGFEFGTDVPSTPEQPEQPALSGTGTEADPYVLSTAEHMLQMRTLAALDATTYFKLGADIDMASVKTWTPVNNNGEENYGRHVYFDGDNHTISNFAPETFKGSYPSIFGILSGTAKNVKLVNANIVGTGGPSAVIGGYVGNATLGLHALVENVHVQGTFTTDGPLTRFGAFAGVAANATFINCSADVTMTSEREDMGAFAGQATGEIVMKNCTAQVNMTNTRGNNAHRTGGLIGYLQASATVGTFENCSVVGVIKDAGADTEEHNAFIGGLFGWAGLEAGSKLIVKNCHSSVNIESNEWSKNIGGLIGNCGKGVLEMTGCYATGSIVGGQQVGGLIGLFEKAYGTVTDSYYTGTINCGAKNYVGGIVGRNTATAKDGGPVTFTNCHSTGAITGGSSCAGILGAVDAASPAVDFIKCYATGDITGASNTGGIVGYHNGGVIKNCWYEGKIVGRGSVGGIAGTAHTTLIENSYVNSDMVVSANLAGGIFGQINATTVSFEMKNCYATGNIEAGSGVGGLIGNLGVKTTAKIENCFSWAAKLISLKGADPTNYASGAIIANIGNKDKGYPESYIAALRNPALEFVDYSGSYPNATDGPETMTNTLCDHDDIVKDNLPPVLVPQDKGYKNDWAQRPYHGKAAAADATPCSIAKAFGWDETVWDLSGTLPKLK